MIKKIYKVRINYKSGHSYTGWFDDLNVKKEEGNLSEISWVCSYNKDHFIYIGLDNIESIMLIQEGYRFMRLKEVLK